MLDFLLLLVLLLLLMPLNYGFVSDCSAVSNFVRQNNVSTGAVRNKSQRLVWIVHSIDSNAKVWTTTINNFKNHGRGMIDFTCCWWCTSRFAADTVAIDNCVVEWFAAALCWLISHLSEPSLIDLVVSIMDSMLFSSIGCPITRRKYINTRKGRESKRAIMD